MDRADRAKQFMPFDALKGFQEALREKERTPAARRILPEEEQEELNRKLSAIRKRDIVEAEYFQEGEDICVKGTVSSANRQEGWLQVENRRIPFENIVKLELLFPAQDPTDIV